MITVII